MQKEQFDITGMTCSACSTRVEKSVAKLPGIKEVSVNLLKNSMVASYDESVLDTAGIVQAVEKAGYGAIPKASAQNKSRTTTPAAKPEVSTAQVEYKQMKQRLQQYEPRVTEAAQETNADRWEKRKQLVDQMTSEMQQAFGGERSDAHDCVVKAVDAKSNELLKAEKGYDKASSIYAGLRDAVGSGSGQSVQDEYNRLVKAGKKPSSMKNEITKAAKADYVDGSDYDREQLAEMLLALTDKDGNALYEQKNLDDWVKQAEKNAEKEAQKENEFDRYDLLK